MSVGFHVGPNPQGQVDFLVQGPWRPKMREALLASAADGLVANHAHGFSNKDLNFLQGLPLRRVTILSRWIEDLSPLVSLATTLEFLSLQVAATARLDLSAFPALRSLACSWATVSGSLPTAVSLEDVYLESFSGEDLSPLAHLTALTSLRMKDRPRLRSLKGVEALEHLQELHVFRAPLNDISALANAGHILDLRFGSCPTVDSLAAMRSLMNLRRLEVSEAGSIESLAPLADLHQLEKVDLHGSTRITDGDLTPLLGLTHLTDLRMMNQRAYSPSVATVRKRIGLT